MTTQKGDPQGLKPALIPNALRGPFDKLRAGSEGPLFHGDVYIREFFRSLLKPAFLTDLGGTAGRALPKTVT